jgi:hypothetical protein
LRTGFLLQHDTFGADHQHCLGSVVVTGAAAVFESCLLTALTTNLHNNSRHLVGVRGFEPPVSTSRRSFHAYLGPIYRLLRAYLSILRPFSRSCAQISEGHLAQNWRSLAAVPIGQLGGRSIKIGGLLRLCVSKGPSCADRASESNGCSPFLEHLLGEPPTPLRRSSVRP